MPLIRTTALAVLLGAPAALAAPAPGMPPVTGSMYDGNNTQAPRLEAAPAAAGSDQRPNDVNQAVTGTGTGASQGHTSRAGGGN